MPLWLSGRLFSPMNIIILKEEELKNSKRFVHINEVLKKQNGDSLKAGILNGMLGTAYVEEIGSDSISLHFTPEGKPPQAPELSLALVLPRPKVLRRVLYTATCLGIKKIHIFNSWRVEKSYWASPLLEELSEHLTPALEQAKDTVMPEITFHRFFTPFVREILPEVGKDTLKLAAHPTGNSLDEKPTQAVTLVIGAEGGFIDKELQSLEEAGFSFFSVGERILNVESAVPFILGKLI